LLQCKNLARSIEYTVLLKAASDEKSVLTGSDFHTYTILRDKNFLQILEEFCGLYSL